MDDYWIGGLEVDHPAIIAPRAELDDLEFVVKCLLAFVVSPLLSIAKRIRIPLALHVHYIVQKTNHPHLVKIATIHR